MYWQLELPMIDMATVKNYHVCDRCYVTGSQDVVRIILFVVIHGVREPTCMWQVFCHKEPRCWVAVYLSLSSGRFISTSSHICSSWYLPIFLFRDGSLTQIRIASLMDLAMFLVYSAYNAKIINRYVMTSGVVIVMDGWGLHVFFGSLSQCSISLSSVFFLTVHPATLVSVYHPSFLENGTSILGIY